MECKKVKILTAYALMHKRYFYGKTMEIPWRYLLFILEINWNEHISYYSRKEVDYMVTVNMTATGANIKNMRIVNNKYPEKSIRMSVTAPALPGVNN